MLRKYLLKPYASIFSNVAWLEASALITSNTFDEAEAMSIRET
jgi:hypothetical protein